MPDELHPSADFAAPRVRGRVVAASVVLVLAASALGGQARQVGAVSRTAVLRAEDARGRGPDGIQPIIEGLRVPALRPIAIRAIGRLERPDLVRHIVPFLSDISLTATTAEALAQSMSGLPPDSNRTAAQRALFDSVFRLLRARAQVEVSYASKGAIARSIARLPYGDARQAREAEAVLLTMAVHHVNTPETYPATEGVALGLYTLARARRALGPLSPEAVTWLRRSALLALPVQEAAVIRRAAWLALTANGTANRQDVSGSYSENRDPQARRLAVAALPNVADTAFQRLELDRMGRDPDPMVRLEWVRVYRQLLASTDCQPLLAAMNDPVHHVQLTAIDALGAPCPEREPVVAALRRTIEAGPAGTSARHADSVSWHARAHALAALARVDAVVARPLLQRDGKHPVWQVRMYVARGALAARDTVLLTSLAFDDVGNVREAAIQGLSTTVGHVADLVYASALRSPDYHVVLAAARALRGAPVTDSVRPAVLDALMRLSREQRQTSRDPRLELLARVRESGDRQGAARLRQLLADVDGAVALDAANVMNHFLGGSAHVTPRPPSRLVTPPTGSIRVRVTMSAATGGGAFELLLDAEQAPMTAARVIELIRNRYYDGLTFHRVVPNFVLQGGSPGMNEYVGDGPFLRDELSLAHHARYTVGISTRGRDTGDAQWFINLVDNYRLDHDYTVFATIVGGMNVVDRILEGDVMESVRVIPK